jgi:hypothetical protein
MKVRISERAIVVRWNKADGSRAILLRSGGLLISLGILTDLEFSGFADGEAEALAMLERAGGPGWRRSKRMFSTKTDKPTKTKKPKKPLSMSHHAIAERKRAAAAFNETLGVYYEKPKASDEDREPRVVAYTRRWEQGKSLFNPPLTPEEVGIEFFCQRSNNATVQDNSDGE